MIKFAVYRKIDFIHYSLIPQRAESKKKKYIEFAQPINTNFVVFQWRFMSGWMNLGSLTSDNNHSNDYDETQIRTLIHLRPKMIIIWIFLLSFYDPANFIALESAEEVFTECLYNSLNQNYFQNVQSLISFLPNRTHYLYDICLSDTVC